MAEERHLPSTVQRSGGSTSLAEVIDRILDKGLVIDAWVRVSLVGIEILTVEARVVVASVDTYLRYAEAISGTQLAAHPAGEKKPSLPSLDEIKGFLAGHGGVGKTLEQLASHFGVGKDELSSKLRELVSQGLLESGDSEPEPEPKHAHVKEEQP